MRVLVAYGTKMGGTEGLAEAVGDRLRTNGFSVDVHPAGRSLDLRRYDAVIVGGALYSRRWHKGAARFVRRNAARLRSLPVWMFSSGPLDDSAHDGGIPPVSQVAKLITRVGARGHATFGGRLPEDAEGFVASKMARTRAGDWREFADVFAWADVLSADLAAGPDVPEPASGAGRAEP